MTTFAESRYGMHEESDLSLPVPGLYADLESGCASIAFTDDFTDLPAELRSRVMQQWIKALTHRRNEAIVEMFRSSRRAARGASIVEQIDQFREECQDAGLTCPADLPLLLQRY